MSNSTTVVSEGRPEFTETITLRRETYDRLMERLAEAESARQLWEDRVRGAITEKLGERPKPNSPRWDEYFNATRTLSKTARVVVGD